MSLSNTLYAGLSGLDVNQVKLNVVGNNIANANTVAFKSSRVLFKPQFYVTDSGGTQADEDTGGSNPDQRGLGAVVGSVERNFLPGSIEGTGRNTDLAIDGAGFFVVRSDEQKYTRDGSFKLNTANQLVTTSGEYVQGYGVDADFNLVAGQLGNITVPLGTTTVAQATSRATLEGNLKASGEVAGGASILLSQRLTTGSGAPTAATLLTVLTATSDPSTPLFTLGDELSLLARKGDRELPESQFTVGAATTLGDLMTFFNGSLGINTAVPDDGNAATPVPGVTLEPDATDPNSVSLVVAGNIGAENALELPNGSFVTAAGIAPLTFSEGTNAAGAESNPTGESIRTSFIVYDSLGTPVGVDVTAVLQSVDANGTTWRFYAESPAASDGNRVVGSGTLNFDSLGRLRASEGTGIAIPRLGTGAATPLSVELDFSQMTALTSRSSELVMTEQDGSAIGRLTDFTIGADGRIAGTFSNGQTRTLGQLALASFSNPQGLVDRGGSMFIEGANSGPAIIGTAGTLGTGEIVSGALELSNVDLSEEFINLIIASTGYSAASRVISTSDQLLTELLNTTR